MSSWMTCALALIGLAGAACGEVTDDPPDGRMHQVACNGGPVDVLENGNFDALDPPWRQEPVSPSLLCGMERITPDSGALAGCLGGTDGLVNALSRDILLPAGTLRAQLEGRICIATEETEAVDYDLLTFEILDGASVIGTLKRYSNQQGAPACAFMDFTSTTTLTDDPVTATFRIQSTLDTGRPTSFYVDTLVLTMTCL